ncbi:MAG: glycoside hydrolase family 99-like domain-containing protein [Candidatus Hydrogenedentes bacterium]|nr:glycoside hydrolase family 99-like domain-containing protein [Candidatus Hydrogenedentota bacterium]
MLGLQLPADSNVAVESVALSGEPVGPAELVIQYFGFENGLSRAGRPERVTAQVKNIGGAPPDRMEFEFTLPEGLSLSSAGELPSRNPIHGEAAAAFWEMTAAAPGDYPVEVTIRYDAQMARAKTTLQFTAPLGMEKADYVPEPQPVSVSHEVCMYYFPGWGKLASWDPIQRVAPWRKPVLGWYDESKPEVVDWQIKWATENGISCFLVDWYWVAGNQHLTHWFEAYRKAVYRDKLKVGIMWANHNPPDTHSREDWRNVTQEWIDHYFNLPSYYTILVKQNQPEDPAAAPEPPYVAMPAVFLWDPNNIRHDLGGSEEVAAAFQESQEMARAAGYPGIAFVALHGHESPSGVRMLAAEGYCGATNYHEWGKAQALAEDPMWLDFADVAATVETTWQEKVDACAPLVYFPVADTGWDARPWHGSKSMVIEGRTPALWEELLREAKGFTDDRHQRVVVLGPANEWGEGSYVMPCTEYGFDMLEAVRRVFAVSPEADWPQNFGPRDVGLGPYDFPPLEQVSSWQFQHGPEGWSAMMGVSGLQVEEGRLVFKTTSSDPALNVSTNGIPAERFTRAWFRVRYTASEPAASAAQLFWSAQGSGTSEAASVTMPIQIDGQWHDYTLDLAVNPRWRGQITLLRLDPCSKSEVKVELDAFALVEATAP